MDDLRLRIQQLLQQLNERVFGKEHVIALSLLSAVAGESIFLLGPPGVAKSMVARRLKLAFRGGEAFEYLMSRFSVLHVVVIKRTKPSLPREQNQC